MSELDVRIIKLEPMRVACSHGFGESPESEAWDKLLAWAKPKGLLDVPHRFFGFNNPNPSPGSPNYGYDQWITVAPDVKAQGDIQILDFPGGLYAVAQCKGVSTIGDVWRELVIWREGSPYKTAHHQWLEELLTPPDSTPDDYVFDLYLPIAK